LDTNFGSASKRHRTEGEEESAVTPSRSQNCFQEHLARASVEEVKHQN